MSIKPVWIVLASEEDLVEVMRRHEATFFQAIEGLRLPEEAGGDAWVEDASADEPRVQLMLHASDGNPGRVGWEEDEVALLERMGVYRHPQSIEARSPELTARLVALLARHARLAVDNDWDCIVAGGAFAGMSEAEQAAFIMAAHTAHHPEVAAARA